MTARCEDCAPEYTSCWNDGDKCTKRPRPFADVPVISILKRHLETSVHYQQVASKIGNPEGYAYVKIPDWEVRQIIEFLESQSNKGQP